MCFIKSTTRIATNADSLVGIGVHINSRREFNAEKKKKNRRLYRLVGVIR